MTTFFIILGIIAALLVAYYFFNQYQGKKAIQMFEQIQLYVKQVPKQKRNTFILLMFKESLASAKKKDHDFTAKFSNPKALEVQLVQMSKALNNRGQVKDKTMKRSLAMYDQYIKWENNKKKSA